MSGPRVLMAGLAAATVSISVLVAAPAATAAPPVGPPTVVSVGDSYISGEAGRWAGNTNKEYWRHDALGDDAYFDNPTHTAELIDRCHRSSSAEAHVGGAWASVNLACSGAKTATFFEGGRFKPGLDFFSDAAGHKGQAAMLQQVAATQNVDVVVVSIGGNDFNFASIIQTCVLDFLGSPSWWKDYCKDDKSVWSNFSAANVAARTKAIAGALRNVRQAMVNAGYADADYRILVQTYPSPIPGGEGFRYPESGFSRQSVGGCGFWNRDADWANTTALPTINAAVRNGIALSGLTNVAVLDLSGAFVGRRLCEKGVGLLEEAGLSSWLEPGAVDDTEWIDAIRTASTIGTEYYVQESLHPNYWAQLALRNCLRQSLTAGALGGSCVRAGDGVNAAGEPLMTLR